LSDPAGSLQRSPRPPSCILGGLLLRGGEGTRGEGRGREGKGRKGRKGYGKGREGERGKGEGRDEGGDEWGGGRVGPPS